MDLINNKSWRWLPRVLWNHLLAASYVLVAGVVVVRFDAEFRSAWPWVSSNALVTNFGDFYPTLIAYPLFFWGITVAYAVVAFPSTGWKLSRLVSSTVGLGLLVHLNFLCLALIGHDDLLAKLPAEMFQYYVRGVIVTCLGIVAALGFRRPGRGRHPQATALTLLDCLPRPAVGAVGVTLQREPSRRGERLCCAECEHRRVEKRPLLPRR